MHQARCGGCGVLLLVVMLSTMSPLFAAEAATAEFVAGTAYALSSAGDRQDLKKGSHIFVGDTVVTTTGRAQLRFTDGGFVSLVPHSEFRVNAYSYSGKPDGTERVALELIKGGLRTISGLIGKSMKTAYEMKTTMATIGIRGTEYTVVYGQSVSGTVSAGAIAVCNSGGCLDVSHGLSYYIKDEHTRPIFINTPAMLSPPQPVIAGGSDGDKGAEDETTDTKPSKKEAALASRDEKDPNEKSKHGKDNQGKPGHAAEAFSFAMDDSSGKNGEKSLLNIADDNSGKKHTDNKLTALPLADLLGKSGIIVNEGPDLGNKGKGKGQGQR